MSVHKKHGPLPPFMRKQVSASFLSKNPQYKTHFKKCPVCNRFSFKPFQTGRKCTLCGAINDTVD